MTRPAAEAPLKNAPSTRGPPHQSPQAATCISGSNRQLSAKGSGGRA